jgi:predicted alpha-1,2-mannosidase
MKHILLVILGLYSLGLQSRDKTLFEIGIQDSSASEFALYPNRYDAFLAQFGGEKSYYVGYSVPEKHWPYVLPGPLDQWGGGGYWAGFHPRHFPSIWFQVDKATKHGDCTLSLIFAGVNNASPVKIRIEINGHRFEKEIKGEDNSALLKSETTSGKPQTITVNFPCSWLKKGINRIQLGNIAGSWTIFDCIRLKTPEEVLPGKAFSSLIRSVKAAPFEYLLEDGSRVQSILVDMTQLDEARELTFQVDGFPVVTRRIETGESIQEIYVPALPAGKKSVKVMFTMWQGKNIVYRGDIIRSSSPLHEYADDVDLLMGTGNSRGMFKPSPCLPLSMVQIAPDNQDEIWKAGYEYTVENIMGFSHITDIALMAGLLMQPTCGKLQVNPGREQYPDEGYRSRIDKSSEQAKIGYYSVFMTDTKIKAELTATRRTALQRYTFPKRNDARVLIDMFFPTEYPHNLTDARITKVSNTEIEGYASYYCAFTGYTLEQEYTLHFVLQFNKPFRSMGGWINDGVQPVKEYIPLWNRNHEFTSPYDIRSNITEINGKGDVGVFVEYQTEEGEEILVRSGISLVDITGARNNLEKELAEPFGWNFEKVVKNAHTIWNDYLGRIQIETDDYLQKKKFYTNLYRAIAAKAVWSDYDGRYRDEDEIIRQLPNPSDAVISGEYWNTFWNLHQLFNLIAPEISSQWARSAIELYKNTGWFNTAPVGIEHTGIMVAMHVISQIQGAWQSGIRDFDLSLAYEGLKKMLTVPPQKYPGGGTVGVEYLIPYMQYGHIPLGSVEPIAGNIGEVSNTLEYAYDDWCLAQMAKTLGKSADYDFFLKRSENWRNIFDTVSGFIRPKDKSGRWIEPFDPYHTPGFTEGNSFNYTWFVPHNPVGLIEAIGKERFVSCLDDAMEKSARVNFNAAGDDFLNYPINHGNETSMQVAYLFNWAGSLWLTQKWIRAIQEQYYGTTPYDAYPGDEDLGQMSGWFVMSALGLFQMDGGCSQEPVYELASPRYPKAVIRLDGKYGRGQTFTIEARNASKENKYIQKVELNGRPVKGFLIPQSEVLKGGSLITYMSATPAVGDM